MQLRIRRLGRRLVAHRLTPVPPHTNYNDCWGDWNMTTIHNIRCEEGTPDHRSTGIYFLSFLLHIHIHTHIPFRSLIHPCLLSASIFTLNGNVTHSLSTLLPSTISQTLVTAMYVRVSELSAATGVSVLLIDSWAAMNVLIYNYIVSLAIQGAWLTASLTDLSTDSRDKTSVRNETITLCFAASKSWRCRVRIASIHFGTHSLIHFNSRRSPIFVYRIYSTLIIVIQIPPPYCSFDGKILHYYLIIKTTPIDLDNNDRSIAAPFPISYFHSRQQAPPLDIPRNWREIGARRHSFVSMHWM